LNSEQRTSTIWYGGRDANRFDLAVEALIPEDRRAVPAIPPVGFVATDTIHYEVGIRLDTVTEMLQIEKEKVPFSQSQRRIWPPWTPLPVAVSRSDVSYLCSETNQRRYEREQPHRNYTSLSYVPSDEEFPATTWLRERLRAGIRPVDLDNKELRKPSPPATGDARELGGSYVARSVSQLRSQNAGQFDAWIAHVRTVLPDIKDIRTFAALQN